MEQATNRDLGLVDQAVVAPPPTILDKNNPHAGFEILVQGG
jgi:hypothetical protein